MNYTKKLILSAIIASLFIVSLATIPAFAQSNFSEGTALGDAANARGPDGLSNYLRELYKIGISVVSALAVVVMMWGGLQWIMAGGNVSRIENAKALIVGSVLGLVIALSSFVLLNTINPQLVIPVISGVNPINTDGASESKCCVDKFTGTKFRANVFNSCSSISAQLEEFNCKPGANNGDPKTPVREVQGGYCLDNSDCVSTCEKQVLDEDNRLWGVARCNKSSWCSTVWKFPEDSITEGQCSNCRNGVCIKL